MEVSDLGMEGGDVLPHCSGVGIVRHCHALKGVSEGGDCIVIILSFLIFQETGQVLHVRCGFIC